MCIEGREKGICFVYYDNRNKIIEIFPVIPIYILLHWLASLPEPSVEIFCFQTSNIGSLFFELESQQQRPNLVEEIRA